MKHRTNTLRKAVDVTSRVVAFGAAFAGVFFLSWILFEVTKRGAMAINIDFFTMLPSPPDAERGGMSSAIVGTLLITGISTLIGVPLGILSGVFLSEVARETRAAEVLQVFVNVLMGVPSIVVGLFVYTILVVPLGHFSGLAGAVSLSIIMLPVVARTTDEMLRLVPNELRESALALGAPRWRVTWDVVFRSGRAGLLTGVLLSVARVSGETAPLLFTALNSAYMPTSLMEPTSNLTVTIFNYAMSPFPKWQQAAWGASLLIMVSVLGMTLLARMLVRERRK